MVSFNLKKLKTNFKKNFLFKQEGWCDTTVASSKLSFQSCILASTNPKYDGRFTFTPLCFLPRQYTCMVHQACSTQQPLVSMQCKQKQVRTRNLSRHGRYPFFRTRFVFKLKFLSKVLQAILLTKSILFFQKSQNKQNSVYKEVK